MTENDPLIAEESERLMTALRENDWDIGHPIHYGLRKAPLCGEDPVDRYWGDEPESVVGREDCLELVTKAWPRATTTRPVPGWVLS